MSQVQLEAFFLVQNVCTAFPSTLVSMLELSPPLPILLLLRVAGLSGLNTITAPTERKSFNREEEDISFNAAFFGNVVRFGKTVRG
jgi:hypothetical protein